MNPNSNHFNSAPTAVNVKRSTFNRPKSHLFTGNTGDLIPFSLDEVLPGDTVTIDTAKVCRMQTLMAPIFDEMFLDTYWFFVPWRLIWSHTAEFFGENNTTYWEQPTEYHIPEIVPPTDGFAIGTLADYMGLPVGYSITGEKFNALPFRAYAKIWNDWFRDENLQQPCNFEIGDTTVYGSNGDNRILDVAKGGKPAKANKIHDYFTSCLPAPQLSADVPIGFDAIVPVHAFPNSVIGSPGERYDTSKYGDTIQFMKAQNEQLANLTGGVYSVGMKEAELHLSSSQSSTTFSNNSLLPSNLGIQLNNSAYSINTLRTAFAVQRYYEKLARGGHRYTEFIKTMFGTTSPDARLQRSEYLGGSRMNIDINQVQATATEANITRLGDLGANSLTGEYHSDFTKSFTEHGYLLGLCVVRYKHKYQNGVERLWRRKVATDIYNPTFAHIGEQPVMTSEIWVDCSKPSTGFKDHVFGYNEAWVEYRVAKDYVSGEFNSKYAQPLDSWHLADNYSARPYLSSAWIEEDKSNVDRVLAVTSTLANQFLFDYYIDAKWTRVMPLYSVPGLIDHM